MISLIENKHKDREIYEFQSFMREYNMSNIKSRGLIMFSLEEWDLYK